MGMMQNTTRRCKNCCIFCITSTPPSLFKIFPALRPLHCRKMLAIIIGALGGATAPSVWEQSHQWLRTVDRRREQKSRRRPDRHRQGPMQQICRLPTHPRNPKPIIDVVRRGWVGLGGLNSEHGHFRGHLRLVRRRRRPSLEEGVNGDGERSAPTPRWRPKRYGTFYWCVGKGFV